MGRTFTLRDEIVVHAPAERCFLLSTSLRIVERELRMRPVRGRTSGLVVGGDTVLWKGWKFGLPQSHESRIEEFQPYSFFRDRMIAGRFASFHHDHSFLDRHDGTVALYDQLHFSMPFGWAGALVGQLLMVPHIRDLMRRRFQFLKRLAEGEEWREYLEVPSHAQREPSGPPSEEKPSGVGESRDGTLA